MTTTATSISRAAHASGTFVIGGDLPVHRIGYGTMNLTGPGHWYHGDERAAKKLLRRAYELGINHFDTADAYGPETAEHLIRRALHRYADGYPDGVVIATKGGLTRQGPNQWAPVGRPEYLRQCIEMSLRRLAVDRIDLYYLHRIDPLVPLTDQIGALADAQRAGKIRHIGLSKVTTDQVEQAARIAPIAAVQNPYSILGGDDTVVDHCARNGRAFVAHAPFAAGALFATVEPGTAAGTSAPAREALTHLLTRAPCVLPIPGTTNLAHLVENAAVAQP